MKKISYLLSIAMALSLSACSQQAQSSNTVFQPPIESIHWGMMPEEVIEVLALPEECILNHDGKIVFLQCEEINIFGQSADVLMTFDVQAQIGLLSMEVCFDDYSQESLAETLHNTYGDVSAVDSEGLPCRWESEKIEDMSEEVQERFRYVWVEYPAENNNGEAFSEETIWNAKKSQPLVAVTLNGNTLNYEAGNMAGYLILEDDNAYEALLSRLNYNDVLKD